MDIQIIGQLHEITIHAQLPDASPIIPNERGYRMKTQKISFFWIKDDRMETFELMGVEIRGKLITVDGNISARDARKTYWSAIKNLPKWIRELADRTVPNVGVRS